jgi:O-methyltransferase involved in polyketide biosynthesis
VSDDLAVVRADFPAYRIWREQARGNARYVARSRYLRLSPHTVVTADLRELRDALGPARLTGPDTLAPAQPNIARTYDYLLGGKDHIAADRAAADAVLERFPEVADVAHANRAFLARAVRYLARKGVGQFVDLGSGLPASPNVHETARKVNPDARVVYVDHDPVVLAHARALLAVDRNVDVVAGDIRDPTGLLASQALTGMIDSTEPVGVLLLSVLHFLTPAQAHAVVRAFREWMAPGSYLVISTGTSTGTDPGLIRALQDAYGGTAQVTGHTAAGIRAWFDGLSLVRPGLVNVWAWRPDTFRQPRPARARFLGGVARKPGARRPRWQP